MIYLLFLFWPLILLAPVICWLLSEWFTWAQEKKYGSDTVKKQRFDRRQRFQIGGWSFLALCLFLGFLVARYR